MPTTNFESDNVLKHYTKSLLVGPYFGKPAFIKFVGKVAQCKILDLGCGTGHFCRDFANMGARCTGVDISKKLLSIAQSFEDQKPLGIQYHHLNGANLQGIPSEIFDKVMIFQVLMNVPQASLVQGIFQEAHRVLKKNGEINFSFLHPLLLHNYKDNLREVILPKNFNYFANGTKYKLKALLTDLSWIKFTNAHWSMEFILKTLLDGGFTITKLEEPMPPQGKFWKYFKHITKVPYFVFIKAVKIDASF